MSPAGFVQPRGFIQARTLPGSIVITNCGLRSYDPFLFPSVVPPWKSRRSPRPKVSFPYSNCSAVSELYRPVEASGWIHSLLVLFCGSSDERDIEDDRFSSVRADFLCTNFQAKCSDVRRRRPPGRSRRRDILDLGHGQERDCGALWTTVVFR